MIGMPGPFECIIIAIVALLLFGRRLPEIARSVGKSIVELKRGLRDVSDDIGTSASQPQSAPPPTTNTSTAQTGNDRPPQA